MLVFFILFSPQDGSVMRCRLMPRAGCTRCARAPTPSGSLPASRRLIKFDPAGGGTRQTKGTWSGRAQDDRFVQDYLWIVGTHGVGRQITSASSSRSSVRPVRRPARVGAECTGLQRPDAWCRCSQFCAIGRGGACGVDLTIDVSPAWQKKRGKRYGDETRALNGPIRVAKADGATKLGAI